ncbi:hypothetical protein HXX76_009069 [Chlamydomonas incerta]|uniref:EGF-like domain-containing protein n=1 Tax=Chlamydomonas incerta TaxID=51695 RepID=A0A835SS55_CHLIN|nr:hypothetical protein HXX76_009069 [Chlamydomonas incerta]|eukprot:KAG2432143.1 hypothetical protein HXX76_009069 [Chlamydomonas incerta]
MDRRALVCHAGALVVDPCSANKCYDRYAKCLPSAGSAALNCSTCLAGFVHASVVGSAELICVRDGTHCQEKNPYLYPTLHRSCHDADGCHAGWTWDAALRNCVDLNECEPGSPYNRCGSVAECINIVGNHVCLCPQLQEHYGGTYTGRYRFDRGSQQCIDDTASPPCVWPQFRFGGQCVEDPCQFNPCAQNERCITAPDGSDYICACKGRRVDGVCKFSPCLTDPCPEPWTTCINNDDWRGRRCVGNLTCPLHESEWCTEPGYVRQRLDCGDGDGVDDWVCTRPSLAQRGVYLSSSDCADDHWPDADASLCPPLFNRSVCPLPSDDWCTGEGLVLEQVDCGDGDAADDWVCMHNATGQRKVLLSSNCTRTVRPAGLVVHGEKVDCGDDDGVYDWICTHPATGQRGVLLSSSDCSDSHWPYANKTLCPSRFSDAMCAQPGNWCEEAQGEVLHSLDCGDGDGVNDWVCLQANTSRRAVLLSSSTCDTALDGWPTADQSMCPPLLNGIMCPLPYNWCEETGGGVLERINCGDGDGVDDWVCTYPNTGQRKVLLSTSNCSIDYWPTADKYLCAPLFNHSMCPMPYDWWCKGDGYVLEKTDCGDGDGVDDWVCTYPATGQRKVLLSSNCTEDHWPQAETALCPLRFNQAVCPMPYNWWCTGDGYVLEKTNCGDGDGVDDWVCTYPATGQRKVLLSSNCTEDHWPQAETALCPLRFNRSTCPMPYDWWCSDPGDVLEKLDCGDGDGVDDWVCVNPDSWMRKVLLSSNCSTDHGPAAPRSLCPPRFASAMCYWPSSECSSDGFSRQRVDCGDGDGIDDWICIQHNTSYRGVLLSSSDCQDSHWTNADKSLCTPYFKDLMCPLRYYWCDQQGEQLQRVNCGDGDGVDDWVCTNPANGQRKVLLSSSDCSEDHGPQAETALCPARFNGAVCPQPQGWCDGEGDHIEKLDCGDGDGIADWVCMNNATGQRGVLLSSSNCSLDYWPQAEKALCPNRFTGAPCPQPNWWCTGGGEHIEKLDCGDGDGVDDWVCMNNGTGQRGVLLSSSNCSLDYWPQAEKSLCPNRFNSAPCPQPYYWCTDSDYTLERVNCGDDNVGDDNDWVCIRNATNQRAVLLSSSNCTLDYADNAPISMCPTRFARLMCPLPWETWCVGDGLVREQLDCGDGDAADDWVCTRPSTSERGVLLSSDCESDHWPDAAESLCPAKFANPTGRRLLGHRRELLPLAGR